MRYREPLPTTSTKVQVLASFDEILRPINKSHLENDAPGPIGVPAGFEWRNPYQGAPSHRKSWTANVATDEIGGLTQHHGQHTFAKSAS